MVPWTISHDDSEDNLQLLCFGCNRRKGAKVEAGRKTWFHADYWPR
ncbi:5-methylcytosine-specific restriction endonuclease McrA [Rhodococcus sp. SORGH_AS303]|nr:5-methylcytosine-specific restriction endonuclease McrA [Rhodococcus sp. SORGH_AS_0303]